MKSRFSLWLTCGLGLGVLPVLANYAVPIFTTRPFSLTGPLSDGELLISSTAIAGAAVGELFQAKFADAEVQASANRFGGLAIIFCALCALSYALVKNPAQGSSSANAPAAGGAPPEAMWGSIALFILTAAVAGICVRVAARAGEA